MASFENDEAVRSVVIANTKFAFNLYRELIESTEDGNFAVSPFAISVALASLYRGAHEQSAEQIKAAMKLEVFDLEDEAIHAAFAELIDFILNQSPNCNLTLLNALFAQEGFDFEEEFEESMKEQYQTHAQSLDFGGESDGSLSEINQWVENSSAAQVKNILSEIREDTLLLLVNIAMYKGQWQRKFDSKGRKDFQAASGPTKATYLGATAEYNHAVLEDLQAEAIEIPYVNGDVSLVVVLPNTADGLAATEEQMTGNAVEEVMNSMTKQRIHVEIPKFKLAFGMNLEDTLRQLDINDVFSLGEADLSGVDGTEALYVSNFAHRTILEVSEDGEPGAGGGSGGSADREFLANHPFLYFVRDNRTETILLMGRFYTPPAKSPEDGLGSRMGMSVKNAFKRMSSKEPSSPVSPGTPTLNTKRQDSSSSQSNKRAAPPPPPSPAKADPPPELQTTSIETQPAGGTAHYGATSQQAQVNPAQPPPQQSKKKQKSRSSLFFCCVKSSADDLDFDSV